MRVCPKCDKTYDDEHLNFCLADGEPLMQTETTDAAPTMILDNPRITNDGWGTGFDPGTAQQDSQYQAPPTYQNQQIYQQPFGNTMQQSAGKDQTLPLISVISGALAVVLSFCCYLGLFIGPLAMITGFIGMKNVDGSPELYEGKGLAIAGMIAGTVGFLFSFVMLIIWLLINLASL